MTHQICMQACVGFFFVTIVRILGVLFDCHTSVTRLVLAGDARVASVALRGRTPRAAEYVHSYVANG